MRYCETKKSVKPVGVWVLLCGAFIGMFTGTFTGAAQAQMKVGANPQSLAADTNLQVEATTNASDGGQFVVKKSTGNVGVGTLAPTNTLHIGRAAVANTLGIRTPVANAALLGTDANGDVIAKPAAACTCGDIKQGLQTANHGDWQKMDGTQGAGSCGVPAVNATGMVLVQGGTVGTTSAATALAQANLPNVNLTAASNGAHTHTATISTITPDGGPTYGNLSRIATWNDFATGSSPDTYGPHTLTMNSAGAHTHTVPLGGSNTPLTTNNLPRLNVNYFVCVN